MTLPAAFDFEDVLVRDDKDQWIRLAIQVRARFVIEIDCSCWQHKVPHTFEAITAIGGGFYVRVRSADPVPYREIDRNGPIGVAVTRL